MKFSAVILAGGNSSRMGQDKAWLEINGRSLLARQVQLAREIGACEVFISGRAGVDYSGLDCRVLRDRLVNVGPLGGIEKALTEMTTSLLLALAVDMPRMTAIFLCQLLSGCEESVGIIPRVNGRVEPLAAFYPKVALNLINEMILGSKIEAAGDKSSRIKGKSISATGFAEKCGEQRMAKFVEVTGRETKFFTNWNSPADMK